MNKNVLMLIKSWHYGKISPKHGIQYKGLIGHLIVINKKGRLFWQSLSNGIFTSEGWITMEYQSKGRGNLMDSMIIAGFFIATIYWVLDSILNIFFSNKYNIVAELFGPDLYDIYIRVVVLCLFLIFGSHAQSTINKLKKARDTLSANEERSRALFEYNPIETITVDNDARVTGYNLAKEKSGDRLPNMGDVMYRDYAGNHTINMHQKLMECISSGQSGEFPEQKYNDKYLYIRIAPFSNGAIITSLNITEQKKAELALSESEERYRTLTENIPDLIYSLDKDGKILAVNKASKRYGYQDDEIIGQPFIQFIHPEDEDKVLKLFYESINTRKEYTQGLQFRFVTKSGSTRWVELNSHMRFDRDGRYYQAEGVCRDITEQKQLHNQLQQIQKMEAIATLAGGIAHQYNNLLNGITGNTELLENDHPGSENIQRYTIRILNLTNRMTRLNDQLLAYARGGKYRPSVISLTKLVEDTLPLLQHNLDQAIHLDKNFEADIPPVVVDVTQIQMVISALINNASEAVERSGRIQILLKTKKVDEKFAQMRPGLKTGDYVLFTVEDNGKGMDEETLNRIFEPFFTTKFQGRGLDMAATYGIVKNHGGWIGVESNLGKGTIVSIFLPAIEKLVPEDAFTVTDYMKGSGTILVIDDEEDVLLVSRSTLERLGYVVLEARTGEEAVRIARSFDKEIDLAILDVGLPDIRGDKLFDLIKEIRPNLKVLVSTGHSAGEVAQNMKIEVQGIIQKPFALTALSMKVKEVLEN
jgi:PAS domain S-box-containing protein